MHNNIAVFGLFPSVNETEKCLGQFRNAGFRDSDISILIPESSGGSKQSGTSQEKRGSKSPSNMMSGGVATDGLLAELASAGVIAIPGAGSYIAVGPIKSALTGGVSGGSAGKVRPLVEGLSHFGLPDHDAKRYESKVKFGNILFTCHCDRDWVDRALEMLESCGAEQVSTSTAVPGEHMRGQQPDARSYGATR